MKKVLFFILFFLNISYFCYSQQDERLKKAEAIQIAYLTKELGLTPAEAEKFWPVFNSYKTELKQARAENPKDVIATEEKIVDIRKKYKPEFKKVLTDETRVNKIFTADKDFREMLRKELQSRKNDPDKVDKVPKGKKTD